MLLFDLAGSVTPLTTSLSPGVEAFIVFVAFIAGLSAAAIGPGGIFLIIFLYLLTPLSNLQIAATSSATYIIGGVIGTVAYSHSGDMDFRMAVVMGVASLTGTKIGTILNEYLSKQVFGMILGVLIVLIGVFSVYRELHGLEPIFHLDTESARGYATLLAIGLVIGVFGGLLGIGGPVLAVPVLVLIGVPMLTSVAVAQLHLIFVTISTTVNYYLIGAITYPLVLLTMAAYGTGTVFGWRVAQRVDPGQLKLTLGGVLVLSGVYLII